MIDDQNGRTRLLTTTFLQSAIGVAHPEASGAAP
jgi:hypothetical protein